MNKIYKIVWNASLGAWVAVSEIAKGKTKTNSGTVGDVASNQKNEITLEKAFNYKALFVAVFTVLVPAFSFAAVGNNSIDTRLCAATAGYSTGDIAVGCGSDSSGTNSIAIGGNATTKVATGSTQGGQSIAIGYDAQTKGDQSVGVGANVRASGNSSIAIGGDDLNKVAGTSNNTAAAQTYKSLTGDNLIRAYDGGTGESSQYFGTSSAGDGSVAIGVQASAKGSLATSFGTRTKADGVASTALGVGATSDKDGSVALGAGSKTDGSATKVQSATVNGLGFTGFVGTSGFAGTASDAGRQVSVGNIGNERQIKNLAPGAISAISTDAINGSQIYAVTNTLIGQIQTTKFASPVVYTDTTGNKLTKASDGKWYLSTAVDAGGNKIGSPTEVLVANVATRLQDANGSTTTPIKLTNVADGTVAANSKDAVNGGQLKSVSDAQTATDASAVKYDSAATKDKVTLGGATGTTISNVKAGAINAGSTDAVNGSQLYATNQNIAQNTANISTLNTTVSNQGTQITANTTDISTLKGGFTLQTNGTNAGAIKAGDTVDIGVADPVDTNLTATKIGKNIAFALNKDLNLTSVMTGNTVINNAGLTADKVTVGNVVIDKSTNKITGIEAGTNSKDAVNKGQLDTLAAQQTATDSAAVKYDNAATKDKVSLGGATGTTITNVKAGSLNATSTDAVNGSQLYATNQNVAQNTANISTLNTIVSNQGTQITANTTDISTLKGGFTLQTNGTNAGAIKAGDTVDIGVSDPTDSNLIATKIGKNIAFALNKDLNLTSVTTGNTVINNAGLTADKVMVGGIVLNKANNDITGLSNKSLSAADFATQGRAATEEQLKTVSDAQGKTDKYAVKYDDKAGVPNKDSVTFSGTISSSVKDSITGKINTTGGTSLSNVASAGDYTDIANASKGVNAGDLNNAVIDAKTAVTNTGIKFGNGTTANQYKLGETIHVKGSTDGSITSTTTADGVQLSLGNTVKVGSGATQITVDGSTGEIGGLSNKTWNASSITSGQAATEDQLKLVSDAQTATDSAAVKYDNAATKDKVSLGGATGTTITNVKAGSLNATSTDAVNGSQLYATNQNVAQNTANISTLNTIVSNQGTQITANTTDISTLKGGFTLQTNGTNAGAIKAGDTVDIGVSDPTDSNLIATKIGKNIAFALNKDLNLTSVTTGNTVINNAGLTADKVTVGNVVIDKTTNKITGIEAGTNSKDAVNKGQLDTLAAQQTATDSAAVKYDNAATKDKVTLGGATGTTITNVKAGSLNATSTDAVNGSQLYAVSNSVKNAIGGNTSINAVTGAITTTNIGGTGANTIDGAINNVSNTAKAAKTEVKEGDNIKVTSVAGVDGQSIYTVATAKDVSFDKVMVGSIVLNKANNDITGLSNKSLLAADFATQGRAATEEQLKTVSDAQGKTDKYAVKYDDKAGVPNKDSVTFSGTISSSVKDSITGRINTTGGTSLSNVASAGDYIDIANASKGVNAGDLNNAVIDAKTAVTNTGIKFGNGTTANQYKLGETIHVKGSTDGSITSTTTADGVQLSLGNTVKVGSGATQITVDGSTGEISGLSNKTWNASSITSGQAATEDQLKLVSDAQTATDSAAVKYDNAATKDKVSLGGATGTTITNVKAGSLNATSTDAVNGSQLYATNQNVAQNTANISTLNTTVSNQGTQITANTTDISTLKGGFTLQTNGTNAGAIKAGDTVDIGVADPVDINLTATKTGNKVAFALNKDLNLNSITANQLAVGNITIDKATNTITGLSNHDLKAADFATKGRAATEEQLKQVISSNITEVVDASGNKVNIIDQVVNTKLDNTNQDSLFLTYNKQGQETTDRLTIGQTVQKMNTEGTKFFHTNADTSKGDLGTTNDSSASGLNSTAIGVNAIVAAGADSSVALGHNAKVQGAQSIAIGNGAEALGTQSISIGTGNKVKGNHSGAIGDPTIVNGNNSYSVGNNNQVLTDDTFVLGNNVTKTVAGSVVLGNGSAATTGAGVIGYALSTATNADKTAINKTTSTTGAVAVGDAASGIYRQITGVAAGIQDADAVNVVQLKAVGNQVVTTQNSLVNSLGGNAKVNANGTITGPTYNVAKSTQINVGDALDALDKAIESTAVTSKTTVTKGQNIVVNKSKNADGSDNYEIATVKDLTVDSVKAGNTVLNNAGITIGNNTVVLNNTGLIIAGGPSITTQGINAGNKQITNVAAGTNATDAVNKGQLDSAINNVASDVTQLSNNAVKYDTASKDKITLGGTNGTTITNVKNGAVVKDSKDAVNGGQLWNVQQQVNQNTNDIQGIQTSIANINNGKSGLVQQQTPNGDITVGKDAGGTTLNVSGTQGDRVVTGVKDGAINATSKDAVNGSQLNVTNNKVAEFLGGGAGYNNITNSFTNPTYKVDGKDYNNVGGAVDALNKADQALGNRITNLGDRLEQAFTETNQRIDGIEQKANAGIAAAMSLEAAPFVAGKYTYAVGAAYHGGENAVGVTLRKTADNGRWSLTGGVAAASQGDPSVRIGISGVID